MPRKSPAAYLAVTILLASAIAATLWVPIYARSTPKLGDFPFFYWYQLILVPAVAILSWLCYLLLRPGRDAGARSEAGGADGKERM